MKVSRRFILIVLLIVALLSGGAVLGSIIPKTLVYTVISIGSIALALFGVWFYNGHQKEDE